MNTLLRTAGQDAPPTEYGGVHSRAGPRGAFRFTRIPIQSGRGRGCPTYGACRSIFISRRRNVDFGKSTYKDPKIAFDVRTKGWETCTYEGRGALVQLRHTEHR